MAKSDIKLVFDRENDIFWFCHDLYETLMRNRDVLRRVDWHSRKNALYIKSDGADEVKDFVKTRQDRFCYEIIM